MFFVRDHGFLAFNRACAHPPLMPASVNIEQLTIVERIIARHTGGATREQIVAALMPQPSKRTMTRWLLLLVERRRIERVGQGPTTRYRALHPPKAGGAPSSAVTTPTAALAASACTPTGPADGRDLIEQIFAAAIGDIVRYALGREASVDYLQRLTERNIASIDDRRAAFAVLKARLDAFTIEDAERYGLEPGQHQRWRAAQDQARAPAMSIRTEAAGSPDQIPGTDPLLAVNVPPPGARPTGEIVGSTRPATRVLVDSHVPRRTPMSAPPPEPAAAPAAGLDMQQTMKDMKGLMTPGRIATTALLAGVVSVTTTHTVGGPIATLMTAAAGGIPPLLYVDRDRKAANNPLRPGGMVATLIAGGTASTACAAPVTYLLESVLSLFR